MPTPGQIIASSFLVAWILVIAFGSTLMRPLAGYLPACTYVAFGACVKKSGNVRPS